MKPGNRGNAAVLNPAGVYCLADEVHDYETHASSPEEVFYLSVPAQPAQALLRS